MAMSLTYNELLWAAGGRREMPLANVRQRTMICNFKAELLSVCLSVYDKGI
jgi:hypothetical protein